MYLSSKIYIFFKKNFILLQQIMLTNHARAVYIIIGLHKEKELYYIYNSSNCFKIKPFHFPVELSETVVILFIPVPPAFSQSVKFFV